MLGRRDAHGAGVGRAAVVSAGHAREARDPFLEKVGVLVQRREVGHRSICVEPDDLHHGVVVRDRACDLDGDRADGLRRRLARIAPRFRVFEAAQHRIGGVVVEPRRVVGEVPAEVVRGVRVRARALETRARRARLAVEARDEVVLDVERDGAIHRIDAQAERRCRIAVGLHRRVDAPLRIGVDDRGDLPRAQIIHPLAPDFDRGVADGRGAAVAVQESEVAGDRLCVHRCDGREHDAREDEACERGDARTRSTIRGVMPHRRQREAHGTLPFCASLRSHMR